MSRILLVLLILLNIQMTFSQSTEQAAKSVTYSFKVVPGKSYLVSASPAATEDAVMAVGVDPDASMLIANSGGAGRTESYRVQAIGSEMQVSVYLNAKDAHHTLSVIDEDQQFPFLRWRSDSSVTLETAPDGFITAFKFRWLNRPPIGSRASEDTVSGQSVAANSSVSYRFPVKPAVPLDILLVPESNHLNLALIIVNNGVIESSDNDRSFENVRLTDRGQVEWTQATPSGNEIEIIVIEKSGFGGKYNLAVRPLNRTGAPLKPTEWKFFDRAMTVSRLWDLYGSFPLINERDGAVYEFLPTRLESNYTFQAASIDAGVSFFLVVRGNAESPPFVIRSGGDNRQTASFSWSFLDGKLVYYDQSGNKQYLFEGFPTRAKLQISVVSTEGGGRIRSSLYETSTLRELELPQFKRIDTEAVMRSLTADYKGFARIDNDLMLYRFRSTKGKSYKIRIEPNAFFDVGIIDPTMRNFEDPTALELTDKTGSGAAEELLIVAKEDFIEFGVIGIRYAKGLVKKENKRIGGEGFLAVSVEDLDGTVPELRETVRVALPNAVVSKELGLEYQPHDPLVIATASRFPPFPNAFDKRILDAIIF